MFLKYISYKFYFNERFWPSETEYVVPEVFHAYLNKFENVVTHLFLVILGNN